MKCNLLLLLLLLGFGSAFAQGDGGTSPSPSPAVKNATSPLISWSEMQKPQPVQAQPAAGQAQTPDPQPETQPAQQPTPSQPSQPQPSQPSSSQPQAQGQQAQPAAQTFTGIIAKDGDQYVLKVSAGSSYKLDDQDKAKQYEGKRVRVLGTLDADTNLIRVQTLELIS